MKLDFLPPLERDALLLTGLQAMLATTESSHLRERLAAAGLHGATLGSLDDLNRLPILRKDDLREIQSANPPFGGLLGVPLREIERIFQSPGPIYDPQGRGADYWNWRDAFVAAGFSADDVALVCFSYHLTPAGQMFDDGARALGCTPIPAGIGNQEQQLMALVHTQASAYIGLPSYLNALLDKAEAQGVTLALRKAFVCAEPLPSSLREVIEARGINVQQGYGTADVGCVAYECADKAGMYVRGDVLVQICDALTGQPLPDGETGEIVVTTLNPTYPMVRFGTGDLSALSREPGLDGRTTPRLLGIRGRLGAGIKVRGLFIYPHQLQAVFAKLPQISAWSAIISRANHRDSIRVQIEAESAADTLPKQVAQRLQDTLKINCAVEIVPAGTLADAPNLRDERVWE